MTKHPENEPAANLNSRIAPDEFRSPPPGIVDRILQDLSKPPVAGGLGSAATSATVVMTPDDTPIRTILTGRRIIVTGFYSSKKAGRALPYEGMNEQTFMKHSEVDTRIVDYRSQPFRFEFVIDGTKRIYIADCVRLLDDGSLEVVEIKGERTRLDDPDYALKIQCVREVCERLGWQFRLITRQQLHTPAIRLANIESIQFHRTVRFDQAHAYSAVELVEREGGVASLGAIVTELGSGPLGMAIAQALMVARFISIDLTRPLSPRSEVTLVTPTSGPRRAVR